MKKGFSVLVVVFFVVALIAVAGGAFYLGATKPWESKTGMPPLPTNLPRTSPSSQSSTTQTVQPLFSGTVKKIDKDLGFFKFTDLDKENGIPDSVTYYEAGTFTRGDFSGYTRILAIRRPEGPGLTLQFVLATKDYSSYLLDDSLNKTTNYPADDYDNPYVYIDKSKIAKTVALDTDHPQTIDVKQPFQLIKQDPIVLESAKSGKKDKNGYDIYIESPVTEFGTRPLSSTQTQLILHAGGTDWGTSQPQNDKEKTALATRTTYLNTTTAVNASDSTGLTYSYILATDNDITTYMSKAASIEQTNIAYKKQVALFNGGKLKEYPPSPETVPFPGMRFTKSSAGLPADYYSTYDSAFPGACGGAQSTFVVSSLQDADLVPVSSSADYPLYTLKDVKHPLYLLAYQTKTDQGEESFKGVNNGKSMPTYDQYVAQHPLLFFKDAWGRWVVVGEFDLKLMGGCGKPVIYLYPEKQTVVHVSFASPVALNTNIPSYHSGWLVSARPDGALTDLQPQYTDCSKLDSSKFGSEYAQNACNSNAYPYLYWSGKSLEKPYPTGTDGWIVAKDGLKPFLEAKLGIIGLTKKEAGDMISYWVPKMGEKNMPYYRIRFLQTREMNDFVPMNVNPRPDSVLRVFLDYKGLSNKPEVSPAPQLLEKYSRNGFTYVEWGGLQQ